jgi:hypothetical protein
MRIVGGEAIPIRIALKKPFKIASGTLTHSNHVLVRLVDHEVRSHAFLRYDTCRGFSRGDPRFPVL